MHPVIDKKSLRAEYLAARARIAPEVAKAASLSIAKHLLTLISASASIIAGYRAVRGEVDLFEAMAQLSERGHALCLPVVPSPTGRGWREAPGEGVAKEESYPLLHRPHPDPLPEGEGKKLVFRRWRIDHPLELGAYGIEIPPASEAELIPNVVLVPLVAFDATGNRLGYGAGFYDATIQALRAGAKPVQIIGVAFAAQQADRIPAEPHDAKLDMVVTEKGIIR